MESSKINAMKWSNNEFNVLILSGKPSEVNI